MSEKNELMKLVSEARASRRSFFQRAAAGSLALTSGALLAGCGGSGNNSNNNNNPGGNGYTPTATDVLNFALNLEYLEAEYYLFATTGSGLSASDSGTPTARISGDAFPTSGPVSFSNYGGIAKEIATDELNHVRFLRSTLGNAAVPRPPINLISSFNAAAKAAGIGSSFDPFASETNFILGAFIFEDVGVTAYHGGASYLANSPYLSAAGGILGTEAYHAGAIREIISELGASAINIANQVSALRASADKAVGGPGDEDPLGSVGTPHIAAVDQNAITFARTPAEVLSIVYLESKPYGGFYPTGLNGKIR